MVIIKFTLLDWTDPVSLSNIFHRQTNTKHFQLFQLMLHVTFLDKSKRKTDVIFFLISADCRVLSIEILPISKLNPTPAMIYGYAKPSGIPVRKTEGTFCSIRCFFIENVLGYRRRNEFLFRSFSHCR